MNPGVTRRADRLEASGRKIRLLIAYDGSAFHGWQRQPGLRTVQACLEKAIARITGEPVSLTGSGRTDAGVHAAGQVAHFATSCRIPPGNLLTALNNSLPPEVRVLRSEDAPAGFHARYGAQSKLYRYRILQAEICSPFLCRHVWHYPYRLDRPTMAEAARALLGQHDFTSFAASAQADNESAGLNAQSQTKKKSTVRRIIASRILWSDRRQILAYEVEANGFLHHMVRNIVGTLVEVGRGAMEPGYMDRVLQARDRTLAGPTAPARGLCLVRVKY